MNCFVEAFKTMVLDTGAKGPFVFILFPFLFFPLSVVIDRVNKFRWNFHVNDSAQVVINEGYNHDHLMLLQLVMV